MHVRITIYRNISRGGVNRRRPRLATEAASVARTGNECTVWGWNVQLSAAVVAAAELQRWTLSGDRLINNHLNNFHP